MKKFYLFLSVLVFFIGFSFGQQKFEVENTNDDDKGSLRVILSKISSSSPATIIILDPNIMGGDVLIIKSNLEIPIGVSLLATNGKVTFKAGNEKTGVVTKGDPQSQNNKTVFSGIIFKGFKNTALIIEDYTKSQFVDINNCDFINNEIKKNNEIKPAAIGLINTGNVVINIKNSSFIKNIGNGAGAIRVKEDNTVIIKKSTFENNKVSLFTPPTTGIKIGKGAAISGDNARVEIENCNFRGGVAKDGGAIFQKNGTLNVSQSFFGKNTALRGGAIMCENVASEIHNNTFFDNGNSDIEPKIVPEKGSALYLFRNSVSASTGYEINFNTIVANKGSTDKGSAVYLEDNTTTVLTANIIVDNYKGVITSGADVYVEKGSVILDNNFIRKAFGINKNVIEKNGNKIDGGIKSGIPQPYKPKPINGSFTYALPLSCGAEAINAFTGKLDYPEDQLINTREVFGKKDLGAIEMQNTPAMAVKSNASILVISDTINLFTTLNITNDCVTDIVEAEFKILNNYSSAALIFNNSTINSTPTKDNNNVVKGIVIKGEKSKSFYENLIKNELKFSHLNISVWDRNDVSLAYKFTDSGGDVTTDTLTIKYPKVPEVYSIPSYDVGIKDTVKLEGQDFANATSIEVKAGYSRPTGAGGIARPLASITIASANFINLSDTTISFVVPDMTAGPYTPTVYNQYGTGSGGGTTSPIFTLNKPKIGNLSDTVGYVGDTIVVTGNYMANITKIKIGDVDVPMYIFSDSSGYFVLPDISASTSKTLSITNAAGTGSYSSVLSNHSDTIVDLDVKDQLCVGDTFIVRFKPKWSFTNTSVVVKGYKSGVSPLEEIMLKDNIVIDTPNQLFSVKIVATEPVHQLWIEQKNNANVKSKITDIVIRPLTKITTQPVDITNCARSSVSLSVVAVGNNLTYEWEKDNNSSIPTVTNDTLLFTYLDNTDVGGYKVTVMGTCDTVVSNTAKVAITTSTALSVGISVNTNKVCEGDTITVSATNIINGGSAPMFTLLDASGSILKASQQASSFTYVPTDTVSVRIKMKSNSICTPEITLSVLEKVKMIKNPNIYIKTSADTLCSASDSFLLKLGDSLKAKITYTFSQGANNSTTHNYNVLDSIIRVPYQSGTTQFEIQQTEVEGCVFTPISVSPTATLLGSAKPIISVISIQHETCKNKNDGKAYLTTGGGKVSWWVRADDFTNGDYMGYFDTLDLTGDTINYIVATDTTGKCISDTSTIEIKAGLPIITPSLVVVGDTTPCKDANEDYTVQSYTNGGANPLFVWYYNGTKVKSTTNASYIYTASFNDVIKVKVGLVSDAACRDTDTAFHELNIKPVSVPMKPEIEQKDTAKCSGTAVYTMSANSGVSQGDTITWIVPTNDISSYTINARTDSLTVTFRNKNIEISAFVTNKNGCISKVDVFKVHLEDCPLIANFTIDNDSICVGSPVTLIDNSVGDDIKTYKWYIDDTLRSTQTTTIYNDHIFTQAGVYDVKLIVRTDNNKQDDTLASQVIHVFDTIPDLQILGEDTICSGDNTQQYTVNLSNPEVSKTWHFHHENIDYTTDTVTYLPSSAHNEDTLFLILNSACKEEVILEKPLQYKYYDLSSIPDLASCNTKDTIILPQALVRGDYKFTFTLKSDPSVTKDTAIFTQQGLYYVDLKVGTTCSARDSIKVGLLPGFNLEDDQEIISHDVTFEVKVKDNEGLYISDFAIDKKVYTTGHGAQITINDNTKLISYKVADDFYGLDSFYYVVSNPDCPSATKDSATVRIKIRPEQNDAIVIPTEKNGVFIFGETGVTKAFKGKFDYIVYDSLTGKGGQYQEIDNGFLKIKYQSKPSEDVLGYDACFIAFGDTLCERGRVELHFSGEVKSVSFKDKSRGDLQVIVYNVVTPDGDGIHDFLEIRIVEKQTGDYVYPSSGETSVLKIFNKIGGLVYERTNYSLGEQDAFVGLDDDGDILPEGTYYYVYEAEVKDKEQGLLKLQGKHFNVSGFFILQR